MGCGKSKHDVVAGNTISQSKKSKDDHANDADNTKPAPETTNINPSIQQEANQHGNEDAGVVDVKQSEKAKAGSEKGNVKEDEKAEVEVEGGKVLKESIIEKEDLKDDDVVKKSENVKVEVEVEVEKAKETKVVIVAEDLKGGEINVEEAKSEKVGVIEEQGQGKMIPSDSQSHLYDSTIDGVISEGLSGATIYYSPPHTKEENPKVENVVVEEKESMEETKMETTNEEIAEVPEEASIKEEVIPTQVLSNNAESDKVVISANEVEVAETTCQDSKTN